jgi:error-prone DNA polymerase
MVYTFQEKFVGGMIKNGYEPEFAERCFKQILGFGEYGFPESHAASFALLVYVSAWFKAHYPAVFACALLNSQPMGFYAPAQILDDAKRHGAKLLAVDVNRSEWENTLEDGQLRLGLCNIKGLSQQDAELIVACRGLGYSSPEHVAKRTGISRAVLDRLATADAFASMTLNRREALWSTRGVEAKPLPLFDTLLQPEDHVELPDMSELEQVTQDYHSLSFSLRAHPVSFLRERLARMGHVRNGELQNIASKSKVKISGLVIIRQRPQTAKGVIFHTIEDESGFANIVIWPHVFEQYRHETLAAPYVGIEGVVEKQDGVIHVIARKLTNLSHHLENLESRSRDFH